MSLQQASHTVPERFSGFFVLLAVFRPKALWTPSRVQATILAWITNQTFIPNIPLPTPPASLELPGPPPHTLNRLDPPILAFSSHFVLLMFLALKPPTPLDPHAPLEAPGPPPRQPWTPLPLKSLPALQGQTLHAFMLRTSFPEMSWTRMRLPCLPS